MTQDTWSPLSASNRLGRDLGLARVGVVLDDLSQEQPCAGLVVDFDKGQGLPQQRARHLVSLG